MMFIVTRRVGKGAPAKALMVGKIVRAPCPPSTPRQTILPTLRLIGA
jgi:hypothetical protein